MPTFAEMRARALKYAEKLDEYNWSGKSKPDAKSATYRSQTAVPALPIDMAATPTEVLHTCLRIVQRFEEIRLDFGTDTRERKEKGAMKSAPHMELLLFFFFFKAHTNETIGELERTGPAEAAPSNYPNEPPSQATQ
jgi:hypothetical protein